MNRTALAIALVVTTALLGACSFAARTNHNYATEAGGVYAYTSDAGSPYQFRYAGTIDGADVVLGGDNFSSIISCAKPCVTIQAASLASPHDAQSKPYAEPKDGKGSLMDLIFDDIAYNKLTADPAATEIAKKALAAPAAAPAPAQ